MKIVWSLFGLFLLCSEVIGGQSPAPTQARGQAPPLAQPFTGTARGLITVHTAYISDVDRITVSSSEGTASINRTFDLNPKTAFLVMPPAGQPAQVTYERVRAGDLRKFPWLADGPLFAGRSVEANVVNGVATEMSLFPSCTRERCSSSACKRTCNASSCVCPKN